MILGFDIDAPSNSRCLARTWSDSGCAAGILLTATGTQMPPDAVFDGTKPSLDYGLASLQNCMDKIANSAGSEDLVYAGTLLLDCCKNIHTRVLEIGDFAGQGIYLSGVVTYFANSHYLHIPFGGGCLYSIENGKLVHHGAMPDMRLIRDAIGGGPAWEGRCWQNLRKENMRLLFSSSPIMDIPRCEEILCEHSNEQSHMNTASMLIRRELMYSIPGGPTAVMEMRL